MQSGCGDEYAIAFTPAGAYLRGFDHESRMSPYVQSPRTPWPGVVDDVPPEFDDLVIEPAFTDDGVPRLTVCMWRLARDASCQHGDVDYPHGLDDPDGAGRLFQELDGLAAYSKYVAQYFERNVPLSAIERVYAHEPLTAELVAAVAAERSLADLEPEAREIGYPLAAW